MNSTKESSNKSAPVVGPYDVETPPSSSFVTRYIIGPNGEKIAQVGVDGDFTCGVFKDVANAHLLAASYELAQALSFYVSIFGNTGYQVTRESAKEAYDMGMAALKKAKLAS